MRKIFITFMALLAFATANAQKFEGLALTPPMGWNSWNTFACDINEQLVKDVADKFIEYGLKDAGYEYIVIDDGWMEMERDENYNLVPDHKKFPNGMKSVADYVHSKGLKFGIYNCAGSLTCGGYPGTRGFEYQDAKLYASWGVDFIKYDWCSTQNLNAKGAYETMRDAIHKAGRPMIFSICEWGDNQPWLWAEDIGHMWRISGDIVNCWDCELSHGNWSAWGLWPIIRMRQNIRQYNGPGHWNDLDMMEVGNGFTAAEDRVHFTMWCILSSPLVLGNDVRSMNKETRDLLTNKEVIAINQDSLGVQGFRFMNENDIEIWVKALANDEWAIAFVNMRNAENTINYDWAKHPIMDALVNRTLNIGKRTYKVRDLLKHKDLGTTSTPLNATLAAHDVVVVRLK